MAAHVDALYRPEPPETPASRVPLTELEMALIRSYITPQFTLGGYAVGRSLDRKLAEATLDIAAVEGLRASYPALRRVRERDAASVAPDPPPD